MVTGAVLGTARDASGTINNDEAVPTLTLSLLSDTIRESNSAGNNHRTTMTLTLDVALEGLTRVSITTDVAQAEHGRNIDSLGETRRYNVESGQLTGETVVVAAVDNDVDEPDRTTTITMGRVSISGSGLEGRTIQQGPDPTVTITDDDDAPTVTLTVQPTSIRESDDSATAGEDHVSRVTATQSHGSSEATTITVSATAVSPAMAGDFNLSSNRSLTIPARNDRQHGRGNGHRSEQHHPRSQQADDGIRNSGERSGDRRESKRCRNRDPRRRERAASRARTRRRVNQRSLRDNDAESDDPARVEPRDNREGDGTAKPIHRRWGRDHRSRGDRKRDDDAHSRRQRDGRRRPHGYDPRNRSERLRHRKAARGGS